MNKKNNKNKINNKNKSNNKKNIKQIKKNVTFITINVCILCVSLCLLLFGSIKLHTVNIKYNKILNENHKLSEINKKLLESNNDKKKINVNESGMASKIPIITFHRVVDSENKKKYFPNDEWVNDLSVTDEELKYLYDNGWKSIDLDEFYCWYNKDCNFPVKTFVITIDDGDSEAYYNVLPVLEKYNFKATLFSIGRYIPEVTEELNEPERLKLGYDKIKELRDNNSLLQVESHSYDLHHMVGKKEVVLTKSIDELKEDFINNEKYEFTYFAYPYGQYNKKMLNAVSNSNIKMAFKFRHGTYATRLDNKYEIARIKVNSYMTLDDFKKIFDYAN